MQEIMRLEKSARFLREKLRDRAKKAKEKNVKKKKEEKSVVKNIKKKKEEKISDKELYCEAKFKNLKKEKVDSHICPGCEGHYMSSQALWRHIRKKHPEIDINLDLKYKACRYCGKHRKAMRQHIKRVHSHEQEDPVVELVKVEVNTPKSKSRPQWSDLVAQAIGALGGLATLQEMSQWIFDNYPIYSARGVTLKQIYQLVNNATNEHKNLWLKTIVNEWGPQQWYVLEDKYLLYVKTRRKQTKDIWQFKP